MTNYTAIRCVMGIIVIVFVLCTVKTEQECFFSPNYYNIVTAIALEPYRHTAAAYVKQISS